MSDLNKEAEVCMEALVSNIPEEQQVEFIEKCASELDSMLEAEGFNKEANFLHGFGKGAYGAVFGNKMMTSGGRDAAVSALKGAGVAQHAGAAAGGLMDKGRDIITTAGLAALATAAVNKIRKTYVGSDQKLAFKSSLKQSIANSEILQEADPIKVKRMANSIYSFAPTVSADPNVLTNILINTIHGESIDLQTVKAVTELEEKLNKSKSYVY